MEAAFPALVAPVAYSLRSSALTVAGPLLPCTGFPYQNRVVRFILVAVEGSPAFPDASLGGITKLRSSRSTADRAVFFSCSVGHRKSVDPHHRAEEVDGDCIKSRRVVCHTGVPAGANRAFSDYRALDGASRTQHFRAQWRSNRNC